MLRKHPKVESFRLWPVFKGLLYVEGVVFFGGFILFRKLCRDQNFRYNCHQRHQFILEAFYNFTDLIGHDYYRRLDYKKWEIDTTVDTNHKTID